MRPRIVWVVGVMLLFVQTKAESMFKQVQKGQCVPIQMELCKSMQYNLTHHPNPLLSQEHQSLEQHFLPLIKTKCHPHLQFFVCSVFAPMCPRQLPQAVTSCRDLCEQVRAGCTKILDDYSLQWPEIFQCDRFPQPPDLCMSPIGNHSPTRPSTNPIYRGSPCPSDLVNIDPVDENGFCALPCDRNVLFSKEEKQMAKSWMIALGVLNLALAAFTFLTYVIDRHRFKFPERCVFFMAFCMALLSLPYIAAALWTFEERACEKISSGQHYLTIAGFENYLCLASFALEYYFSTAACLWWLMFSFTWYLSAGRRWVPEGVEACSPYVHLIAWGVAALATTIVLIMHKVDASELTGVCAVGNTDPEALLAFVLIPRTLSTILGIAFIVAGLSGVCKEGQALRRRGTDTSKNHKLVLKMIMFCLFYLLPVITVLACDYFRYIELGIWTPSSLLCKQNPGITCKNPHRLQPSKHHLSLIMNLFGGTAAALWILSPKTFASWQRFVFCGVCSEAPQKTTSASRLAAASSRPLLEPPIPVAPPPHPPTHYAPLQSMTHVWRPSNVV